MRSLVLSAKITEAKRNLYKLLLDLPNQHLTNNEIELAYHLSKDLDIQNLLNKKITK